MPRSFEVSPRFAKVLAFAVTALVFWVDWTTPVNINVAVFYACVLVILASTQWPAAFAGYKVRAFVSAEEFLEADQFEETDCLILDVRMAGMSGLELQRQLKRRSVTIPIIFITAHGDEETKRQALSGGAVAFLIKPFEEDLVLNALNTALDGK